MDEQRELSVAVQPVPAGFCIEQRGGHPAQAMITALPAFDSTADGLHHREAGLNSVGTAKRAPQAGMHLQIVQREGLFKPLH